jgi:sphingolipid 4-desaturase/C4-monooxygenase
MKKSHNEFYWDDDREPHVKRRKEILAAHPEVKKLFGVNPRLKYSAVLLVLIQLTIGLFIDKLVPLTGTFYPLVFLAITYFVGATIGQALFLAIHEITHNFASKNKTFNNWLSFFINIPIVLPFAYSFKLYHGKHHWHQGKDGVDL